MCNTRMMSGVTLDIYKLLLYTVRVVCNINLCSGFFVSDRQNALSPSSSPKDNNDPLNVLLRSKYFSPKTWIPVGHTRFANFVIIDSRDV